MLETYRNLASLGEGSQTQAFCLPSPAPIETHVGSWRSQAGCDLGTRAKPFCSQAEVIGGVSGPISTSGTFSPISVVGRLPELCYLCEWSTPSLTS